MRHRNAGLRKLCEHPRRTWAKCACSWHFSFKWGMTHHRFSLDKHFKRRIESKIEADELAGDLRKQIRNGTFGRPTPVAAMTLQHLVDLYDERYDQVERASTREDFRSGLRVITGTVLPHPTGGMLKFGDWVVADIRTDTIERYREVRRAKGTGVAGTNRSFSRLRVVFNWAIKVGYVDETPFDRKGQTVVKMSRETPRNRRLNADIDEEAKLLGACDAHLRSLVECALETGMRRGEITNLRWRDVQGLTVDGQILTWAPRAAIVLAAEQTKTRTARTIPISTRLKFVLELRRFDPAGAPLPLESFVFGNAIGQRIASPKRAWMRAVLKAHGIKPGYTATMNLDAPSRAAFKAINLHFHDLRREAGSRWLDGGVPLHVVRDWLGHSNISQTSTYLSGTAHSQHDAMAAYERACNRLATAPKRGGRKRTQSAAAPKEKRDKSAVDRGSAIM